MRVSFIIPLYNCLPLTQAMLASLRTTLPADLDHEIILIDDGSTDGTHEWLTTLNHPAIRVLLNERNLGYAAANNRGAAIAGGELLALLNNDLILAPRWLEPMLAAHHSLGGRAGLVGNVQLNADSGEVDHVGIIIDARGKPEHDRTPPSRLARLFAPVSRVPAVTAACVVLGRALWQQLGGFDQGYVNGGEDVDLCFRVRAAGRVNAVALRSVVRHHVSSSVGRKLHDEENSRRLAQRWRREFALAAARRWCRDRFESILLEPRDCEPAVARRVWFHALGLTRTPPPEAIVALDASLDRELARWREILPSSPGADS